MPLTKKQRLRLQKKCKHVLHEKFVYFKNGTKHLEVRCIECNKFFGYKKQHQRAFDPERIDDLLYDDELEQANVGIE